MKYRSIEVQQFWSTIFEWGTFLQVLAKMLMQYQKGMLSNYAGGVQPRQVGQQHNNSKSNKCHCQMGCQRLQAHRHISWLWASWHHLYRYRWPIIQVAFEGELLLWKYRNCMTLRTSKANQLTKTMFTALTGDHWISVNNSKYLGVTAHLIDENWQIHLFT